LFKEYYVQMSAIIQTCYIENIKANGVALTTCIKSYDIHVVDLWYTCDRLMVYTW